MLADKPPAKRKSKIMNVTERKSLLDSRDNTILSAVVKANDLKQQLLVDQLKKLPEALCTNDLLLKTPVSFLYVAFHSLSRSHFPPLIQLYLLITFFMNPVNTQTMRLVSFPDCFFLFLFVMAEKGSGGSL